MAPSADLSRPEGCIVPPFTTPRDRSVFDIYTIIFLALAVFIFLRLRSVLGQRTGRERPPYDPYATRDAVRSPASDKVVALPPRPAEAAGLLRGSPPALAERHCSPTLAVLATL